MLLLEIAAAVALVIYTAEVLRFVPEGVWRVLLAAGLSTGLLYAFDGLDKRSILDAMYLVMLSLTIVRTYSLIEAAVDNLRTQVFVRAARR